MAPQMVSADSDHISQPQPVRSFASTPSSASSPTPLSSSMQYISPESQDNDCCSDADSVDGLPHKSRSIVSLTTSALTGIFGNPLFDTNSRSSTPDLLQTQPSSSTNLYGEGVARLRRNEGSTVWVHPRQTLDKAGSLQQRRRSSVSFTASTSTSSTGLASFGKISLLFSFGVAYGHLVTQLQDNHFVTNTTLNVDPVGSFTLTWGFLGIALGSLLPFVDSISPSMLGPIKNSLLNSSGGGVTVMMYPIIRAVGIFIGVSYGIVSIFAIPKLLS